MAAHVQNVITFNTTAGNKSATLTPAVGGLLVVVFAETGQAVTGTVADDRSGTYTVINKCLRAGSASYAAIAIRDQLVASALATIVTMTAGGTNTGGGLNVLEFSGMARTGAAAARQSQIQSNQGAGGTPAPVFPAACLTANPTIGAVNNATNPATMTVPSGWTERQDVGFASPAAGLETVTRDSGFTGTTVTWGGTSASAFGDIVVELDTSVAAMGIPRRLLQAVNRAAVR